MSDETNNPLYMALLQSGRKTWRRKRKHKGETWEPAGDIPDTNRGVWCISCHVVHPYNGQGRLRSEYERRSGHWVLMWLCPVRGNVVGEIELGGRLDS